MLNYLKSQGQPVSYPMPMDDGEYLTVVDAPEGVRYVVLFTEAAGKLPEFTYDECRQYGELVASLHACMDKQPEDKRRFHLDFRHLVDEPLIHIAPFLAHRPEEFERLQQTCEHLKSELDGLLQQSTPQYGCCHGDHHGDNVHLDDTGRMTVFDFDCYGYGWRAYDIAVFLWQLSGSTGIKGSSKGEGPMRWRAFIEGYSKIRSLTKNELKATQLFVPIRRIWWMGMHTRWSQTIGPNPWPNLAGLDQESKNQWIDRNIGLVREAPIE